MRVIDVRLDQIEQRKNSRVLLGDQDLSELMNSIRLNGLLQPIVVRALETEKGRPDVYEVVCGNRRLESAKKLGWVEIPAVIRTDITNDRDRDIANLVENLNRKDITTVEEGLAYQGLFDGGMSLSEIAARTSQSLSRIDKAITAYKHLPEEYRGKVLNKGKSGASRKGILGATVAVQVLKMKKSHKLNNAQTKKLLEFASQDGTSQESLRQVAPILRRGYDVEEAISFAGEFQRVAVTLLIKRTCVNRLEKRYNEAMSDLIMDRLANWKELEFIRRSGPRSAGRKRSQDVRHRANDNAKGL